MICPDSADERLRESRQPPPVSFALFTIASNEAWSTCFGVDVDDVQLLDLDATFANDGCAAPFAK